MWQIPKCRHEIDKKKREKHQEEGQTEEKKHQEERHTKKGRMITSYQLEVKEAKNKETDEYWKFELIKK